MESLAYLWIKSRVKSLVFSHLCYPDGAEYPSEMMNPRNQAKMFGTTVMIKIGMRKRKRVCPQFEDKPNWRLQYDLF